MSEFLEITHNPVQIANFLRAAIASYRRFQRLTQAYVDLIVRRTRAQSPNLPPHRPARLHP